jgi:hypothetical protein
VDERFVAFIDILGFRSLMSRIAKGDRDLFAKMRRILELTLEDERRKYGPILRGLGETCEMTCFSDSVIISDTVENYFSVVYSARDLCVRLLHEGVPVRGAILRGPLYHDRRIAFGPGLVQAYELETSAAIYPRIIVTDEIRERMVAADTSRGYNIRFAPMLSQDADGLWFIDPFSYPWVLDPGADQGDSEGSRARYFASVRSHIIRELAAAGALGADGLGILAKWRWLAQRFNGTTMARNIGERIALQ